MTPAELSAREQSLIHSSISGIARNYVPPNIHTSPESLQQQRVFLTCPHSQLMLEMKIQPLLGVEIRALPVLLQRNRRQLKEELELQETGNS